MTLINKAAATLRKKMKGLQPRMVLTLGSGLGAVADLMKDAIVIPYQQIPGFPPPTVAGHAGTLSIGTVEGVPVIFMKGRKHLYEDPIAAATAIKRFICNSFTRGAKRPP